MTDASDFYERELTPAEIEERKSTTLELLSERDDNLTTIEDKRREIRMLNVARKKLDLQCAQLRREIKSGKVLEPRQIALPLGQQLDLDAFDARYPRATDAEQLHRELSTVLQGVLVPSIEKLAKWHPASGVFFGVASWARIELAYMNAKEHPDLALPERGAMPIKLAELRSQLGQAVAAGKKRKGKAPRPASGTPIARPRGGKRKARA